MGSDEQMKNDVAEIKLAIVGSVDGRTIGLKDMVRQMMVDYYGTPEHPEKGTKMKVEEMENTKSWVLGALYVTGSIGGLIAFGLEIWSKLVGGK